MNTTVNADYSEADLGFVSPLLHTVELSDAATDWAIQVCRNATQTGDEHEATDSEEQWQGFLRALAVAGFEQWLSEGTLALQCTYAKDAVPSPGINAQVGDYDLCILAMGGWGDTAIEIKDGFSADKLAHLYVLVEVQEDINQVSILAGLPQETLLQLLQARSIELTEQSTEQTLRIPITAFEIMPEKLLLYLDCLEPDAMDAPVASAEQRASLATLAEDVTTGLRTDITTGVINAGRWVQDQLGELATQLSWALLPPMTPAAAMRPVRTTVETVLEVLARQGVRLPVAARGVSGPVEIGEVCAQIYAWAWPEVSADAEEAEWSLFVLLGPQAGDTLPVGIQLQVSDGAEVLAQERLTQASETAYLYTQVQGTQAESFGVKVVLPNGEETVLPAFGFELEQPSSSD